jgi:alcohol dehydrogenase (cytochrome c)
VKSRLSIVVAVVIGAALHAAGQVTPARVTTGATADGHWPMYSGTYASHRFSPLDQITVDNVGRLKVLWVHQPPGTGPLEGTPIIADGAMFVTSGPAVVAALHPKSGRPLWEWSRPIGSRVLNLGFPRVNRGVALLDDRVFVGTLDGYLVALDAKSGVQRWIAHVGDNATGHAITAAPLVADGKVIVGVSGGEAGIRGYLDAYDAATGTRVWRAYTVPSPGEPGNETWEGDSWKFGAGATWLTGSYDPALKLLYWGTGNPGPDWNGDARKGDNLYTCSLLALDVETGKRRWHFQFTPHDTHDWDANQIPVLVDGEFRGRARALVVTANRNGFFYVLDRTTGEYLLGAQYARQTWARGLDDRGRPVLIPNMEPSEQGTLVYPSLQGSTNWSSPSFSPATGLLYVPVREMGSIYFKSPAEYRPGTYFTGGSEKVLEEEAWGAVRAIEVATGKVLWDFRLPTPPWAGVMATAGGVVFGGSNEGNFYALEARTGKALWQFQTGGPIRSGPMAFLSDGKQRIAVAGGRGFYVFGLE